MAAPAPNILFIMTDQQRGDCLGVEGHPVLQTPNMDAIATQGVRFSRFYSACPSCIAARRSLMVGQAPQTHGVVGYRDGLAWAAPPTLPQVLREHGYHTALVGRSMHLYPVRKRYGFDEMVTHCHMGAHDYDDWLREHGPAGNDGWFSGGVMHNDWTARPWPYEEHLHRTNWTVSEALRFLERRDPDCPWFLVASFVAPHPPLQPPAFYLERYLRTGVPDPVIGDWATAPTVGEGGDPVAPDRIDLQGEALLSARAAYYGLINHVDDQIRRLLNGITGYRQHAGGRETVVVFTSDHGEMLGDHHMWRKSRAFESSARIPFLLQCPPSAGVAPGQVLPAVATHADIMPTLLDLAGLPVPDSVDGASLLPLLRGTAEGVREYLHIEHAPYGHGLTDGRHKYIWQPADGRELLFALDEDPTECRNLAGHAGHADTLAQWRGRLVECLRDRPEGFVRNGALVPGQAYGPVIPGTNEQPLVAPA